jgi:hypothetical protein
MQNLIHFFGRPLFLYFSFFFIFNANGQLISAKMEKDFREDARIKVAQAAKIIDQSVLKYEKEGPQAFINSFETTLSPSDKSAILKELKGLPPMPRVKMEGNNLVFLHKNKKIAEFDSYDVAQGIYQSGEIDLFYDSNMSLVENIEAWKKVSAESADTSSFFWMNLILPQAEAKNSNKRMIPLMFAAGIVGILLGVILGKTLFKPKVAQHKNAIEPNPASDGAAQRHDASEAKTQEGKGIQSNASSKKKPSKVSGAKRPSTHTDKKEPVKADTQGSPTESGSSAAAESAEQSPQSPTTVTSAGSDSAGNDSTSTTKSLSLGTGAPEVDYTGIHPKVSPDAIQLKFNVDTSLNGSNSDTPATPVSSKSSSTAETPKAGAPEAETPKAETYKDPPKTPPLCDSDDSQNGPCHGN